MRKTIRVCQNCGKQFQGNTDSHYCNACVKIKKLETVIQTRICQECGTEFPGGPRAKRCPDCRTRANKENVNQYRKRGALRPIGSKDICVICGEEYIVTSGRQKYCSEKCQRIGVLQWQKEHKKGYSKKPEIKSKKQEIRNQQEKVCIYCFRTFKTDSSSPLCSDYCRAEQKKLVQCMIDVRRGKNGDLKKYEDKRDKYRQEVKNNILL